MKHTFVGDESIIGSDNCLVGAKPYMEPMFESR